MEQFLFQEPIFLWLGTFSLENTIITLIIWCVVFLWARFFQEKKAKPINNTNRYERVIPKNALEKYTFIIKDTIQILHPEKDVFAQTATEIAKYYHQNELIDILKEIETIEYSWKKTTQKEIENIEKTIGKFIKKRK
jgi:hypothetical protein